MASDREQRQPPDPVVGEPGDEPEQDSRDDVEWHLPLAAPDGEQQDQPGGDAEAEGDEARKPAEQRAEQGAQHQRPGHEGRGRKEPAVAGAAQSHGSGGLALGHPFGDVGLGRRVGLDADRLGGDADVHVERADVLRRHRHRADHRVPADPNAGQDGRVIGDAHVVLEHGPDVGHFLLIHDAVGVAVDVRVVGDADAVAQRDAAAVVEQHVAVHDAVVAHLQVVAVRELDELEALEVAAARGAKRCCASTRRKRTPRWTLPAPRGERSKLCHSQCSGLTRA